MFGPACLLGVAARDMTREQELDLPKLRLLTQQARDGHPTKAMEMATRPQENPLKPIKPTPTVTPTHARETPMLIPTKAASSSNITKAANGMG